MSSKDLYGKNLEGSITSDDILGKDVIDIDGSFIGTAEKVFFDKKDLEFIGIAVDKGILKKGLTIGRNYIKKIMDYAIFLNVSIAYEIRGMIVFDKNGKKVGIIKDLTLDESGLSIQELLVKTGMSSTLKIKAESIGMVGNNVILKITQSELNSLSKE